MLCGQALCGQACRRPEALAHIWGSEIAASHAQLLRAWEMAAARGNSRLEVLRTQVLVQTGHAQPRQELVLENEP